MILKNLTRKKTGTRQLVRYIFRYMLQAEKTGVLKHKDDCKPFIFRHNIKSKTVEGFIKEFENNLLLRKRKTSNQTIIHHTILSWSHKDANQITDKKLRTIARRFVQLRGENNLFVGTKHSDRSHIHLHFAVSGNQINGCSSRLSKKEFEDLKKSLDEFQKEKYPELSNSLPRHGLSKEKRCLTQNKKTEEVQLTKEKNELTEISQLRKGNKKREVGLGRELEAPFFSPFQHSPFGEFATGGISSPTDTSPG